jgi:hypothetical protein
MADATDPSLEDEEEQPGAASFASNVGVSRFASNFAVPVAVAAQEDNNTQLEQQYQQHQEQQQQQHQQEQQQLLPQGWAVTWALRTSVILAFF